MTHKDISELAKETTEKQFDNLFNLFSQYEIEYYNSLLKKNYHKYKALWITISKRYAIFYCEDETNYKPDKHTIQCGDCQILTKYFKN